MSLVCAFRFLEDGVDITAREFLEKMRLDEHGLGMTKPCLSGCVYLEIFEIVYTVCIAVWYNVLTHYRLQHSVVVTSRADDVLTHLVTGLQLGRAKAAGKCVYL